MNNTLRLQIVTALDNAGIKATKEQIDSLTKSIQNVNKGGSFDQASRGIGKMQGPLGKLQDMFKDLNGIIGKIGVSITAVAASFKAGWDVGEWIDKHVIQGLFGVKEAIDDVKKKNREVQRENEKLRKSYEESISRNEEAHARTINNLDDEAKKINNIQAAWMRANKARNDYNNANQDIEIQQLERERFEDILKLQGEGDYEGAEQANKLYDFYRKQLEAKKELQKFDQETYELQQKQIQGDEKRYQLVQKIWAQQDAVRQAEKDIKDIEDSKTGATSEQEYLRQLRVAHQRHYSANRKLVGYQEELDNYDRNSSTYDLEMATRLKNRAVLADRLRIDIDQAAWNYDQYINQNGNSLGISFNKDYIEQLAQNSKDTANDLAEAVKIGIKEGFLATMEFK